jgi:outer membrane protein TolC
VCGFDPAARVGRIQVATGEIEKSSANDADQLRSQEAASRTAVSALDLARRSFTLGNTGIIDVIDAQRQFAQAELGLSRARAQRLIDTAQLYLALGGTPLAGAGAPPPHRQVRSPQ